MDNGGRGLIGRNVQRRVALGGKLGNAHAIGVTTEPSIVQVKPRKDGDATQCHVQVGQLDIPISFS